MYGLSYFKTNVKEYSCKTQLVFCGELVVYESYTETEEFQKFTGHYDKPTASTAMCLCVEYR